MANKPLLIVAGVVLLLSIGSLTVIGTSISGIEQDFEDIDPAKYLSKEATSHNIVYLDEDGAGSGGYLILIPGEYTDADEDQLNDECVAFEFTVKDSNGTDVTNTTSETLCSAASSDYEYINAGGGWMVVATVCDTYADTELEAVESCSIGDTYAVESTTSMMVFDSDAYFIELLSLGLDFLGEVFGAGCVGILGICCGLILLITGLIVGGKQQPPVMMAGMPMGQQPAVSGFQAAVGYGNNPTEGNAQNPMQQYAPPVNQVAQQMVQPSVPQAPASQIWDQPGNQ
ncbi:MAG: hypothetical protein OSA38_07315 [Candidatus Poseidoniaceae archaeon]|nr:hypothetical protein [Candidatus Poseidoniaceae archaeon]